MNASLLKARRCESPRPAAVTIEVAGGAKHELAAADDAELAEWLAAIAGARSDGDGGEDSGADGDEAGGEAPPTVTTRTAPPKRVRRRRTTTRSPRRRSPRAAPTSALNASA